MDNSLLLIKFVIATKPSFLLKSYLQNRKLTEDLCSPLEVEDYVPHAVIFIDPPKWYLAHATIFYEEMI